MRIPASLWLLFGMCSPAAYGAAAGNGTPVLNILVCDRVGIEDSTIRCAIDVAQQILRDAGVHTDWKTCPLTQLDPSHARCLAEAGPRDIFIRILARPLPGQRLSAAATGSALLGQEGGLPAYAYVYYDRVSRITSFHPATRLRVLGHAIAHEIGHLLGLEHSWYGIMRGEWSRDQLWQMSTQYLLFPPGAARTVQESVRKRVRSRGSALTPPSPSGPGGSGARCG